MSISEKNTKMQLTIPKKLKHKLELKANNEYRSLNNLIVYTLKKSIGDLDHPNVEIPSLEKDLNFAKNWFEWLTSKEYMNIVPFGKQVEMGAKLFEDYCPGCSDLNFLDNLYDESVKDMSEKITWLEDGVCPKCEKNRLYWYKINNPSTGKPYFTGNSELHACVGQRGSKTTISALLASYVLHKAIQVPDLAEHYNQLSNQIFTISFISIKPYNDIWEAFRSFLKMPWFKNYFRTLEDIELDDNSLLINNEKELLIKHKGISCEKQGITPVNLKGYTRLFTVTSNFAFYNKDDAKEIRTSLTNSLTPVRKIASSKKENGECNIFSGYEINISSLCSEGDPLIKLVEDDTAVLTYRLASWEMNPMLSEEDLRKDHGETDNFDRDFGCVGSKKDPNLWIPKDLHGLNKMFRDLYIRNSICNKFIDYSVLDMYTSFNLIEVKDSKELDFYKKALNIFDSKFMKQITKEYLILGRHCSYLIYDTDKGYWIKFRSLDSDNLNIRPIPKFNVNPNIDYNFNGEVVPLKDRDTLWVARQTSPNDYVGTSLYTRVLSIIPKEKELLHKSINNEITKEELEKETLECDEFFIKALGLPSIIYDGNNVIFPPEFIKQKEQLRDLITEKTIIAKAKELAKIHGFKEIPKVVWE